MLTDSATQPKFFRNAAIVLLAIAAWFSAATLATAQDQNQDQSSAQQSQRTDSGIQSDVAAALQQDTSLQGQRISAKSDKGVVTLTGNVQTEAQSQQAETDAANVAGVSGILNQLKVQNPGNASSSAGIAAQTSANQISPEDQNQNQPQNQNQNQPQTQNQNSIPPPPPDEAQPQQPQQSQQQAQQPEQPYGAQPG
ncbi:MAG TPA: BON domain-containing protein, partial [Terriglobia bacterium]|nr:BON domain-containing protein [Terriglobia bacterium]